MARAPFLDKFHSGSHMRRGVLHSTEHVLSNLEAILNTKEGFGYFVRGFTRPAVCTACSSTDITLQRENQGS